MGRAESGRGRGSRAGAQGVEPGLARRACGSGEVGVERGTGCRGGGGEGCVRGAQGVFRAGQGGYVCGDGLCAGCGAGVREQRGVCVTGVWGYGSRGVSVCRCVRLGQCGGGAAGIGACRICVG